MGGSATLTYSTNGDDHGYTEIRKFLDAKVPVGPGTTSADLQIRMGRAEYENFGPFKGVSLHLVGGGHPHPRQYGQDLGRGDRVIEPPRGEASASGQLALCRHGRSRTSYIGPETIRYTSILQKKKKKKNTNPQTKSKKKKTKPFTFISIHPFFPLSMFSSYPLSSPLVLGS